MKQDVLLKKMVLDLLKENPFLTKNDIMWRLNLKHQTATSVLSKLHDAGLIYVTGITAEKINIYAPTQNEKEKEFVGYVRRLRKEKRLLVRALKSNVFLGTTKDDLMRNIESKQHLLDYYLEVFFVENPELEKKFEFYWKIKK